MQAYRACEYYQINKIDRLTASQDAKMFTRRQDNKMHSFQDDNLARKCIQIEARGAGRYLMKAKPLSEWACVPDALEESPKTHIYTQIHNTIYR